MSHIKIFLKDFALPVLVGIIVAKLLTTYVIQFNIVNGESMEPTLQHKDYLVSEKLSYLFNEPQKGDIVIVKLPQEDKFIIKRVIGIEGDTVQFIPKDAENNAPAKLLINGKIIQESYIKEEMNIDQPYEYVVEEGKVFLLGDNRNNSSDSRVYGSFNISDLEGKIFFEVFNNIRFY